VIEDPEPRIGLFLTKQGQPVDREGFDANGGKVMPQHRQGGLATFSFQSAGQRHVETEFFHDIGISPAIEIFALPWRQGRRISISENADVDHSTIEQLQTIYGQPNDASTVKVADRVAPQYRVLIDKSPFAALATCGPEGLFAARRPGRYS
jgi:hypothetical protein